MSDAFIGEIRIMSFNFPPRGWAFCNGQTLSISQNLALFSLIGTNFGGNGSTNFLLPNYQTRVPIHVGAGHQLGEPGGEPAHTLTTGELPTHSHTLNASASNGNQSTPQSRLLAAVGGVYGPPPPTTSLSPTSVGMTGGNQPHENMMPYSVLSFCIALQGSFPSRN